MGNKVPDDFESVGRYALVEAGLLPVAGRFIADFSITARQGGMACLAEISRTEELNLAILEAGLLNLITLHVTAHMDEETQEYATIAMKNFLCSGGHEALPDSVADDHDFQAMMGRAMLELSKDETNHAILTEEGCLWVLCALGTHQEEADRELAATMIADLAEEEGAEEEDDGELISRRVKIASKGGLHGLIGIYTVSKELPVLQEVIRALRNLCSDAIVQASIVNYGGISLFVSMGLSQDHIMQVYSAQALSMIISQSTSQEAVLHEGGLQTLLAISDSEDLEARSLAAGALMELAKFEAGRAYYASEAGANLLRHMTKGEGDSARDAAVTLSSLALDLTAHRWLIKNQVVTAAVQVLQDPSKAGLHEPCITILANLAQGVDGMQEVMEAAAIPGKELLLEFLESKSPRVRATTGRCIANLAVDPNNASHLISGGFIKVLTTCSRVETSTTTPGTSQDDNARFQYALALCRMIIEDDVDSDAYEELVTKDLDVLLPLLDAEEEEVLVELSHAIRLLVEGDNIPYKEEIGSRDLKRRQQGQRKALTFEADEEQKRVFEDEIATLQAEIDARSGQRIIECLKRSGSAIVARNIAVALVQISLGEEGAEIDSGYGAMLTLYESEDMNDMALAREALARTDNATVFGADVDIAELVQQTNDLYASGDEEQQRRASRTYRQLASQANTNQAINDHGALPMIIALAGSLDEEAAINGAFALGNMSASECIRGSLSRPGVPRMLVPAMKSTNNQVLIYMASTMCNIQETENFDHRLFAHEGLLEALWGMLFIQNISVNRMAARAVLEFLKIGEYDEQVAEAGAVEVYIRLVSSKDSKVRGVALESIMLLMDTPSTMIAFHRRGVAVFIIQAWKLAMQRKNIRNQTNTGTCIALLCALPEAIDSVLEIGGLEAIKSVAASPLVKHQEIAARAVAYICESKVPIPEGQDKLDPDAPTDFRQRFAAKEGVSLVLVLANSEHAAVRASAARGLASLAELASEHERILADGGVHKLLEIIRDDGDFAVRSATRAMSQLCCNEAVQLDIGCDEIILPLLELRKGSDIEVVGWSYLSLALLFNQPSNHETLLLMLLNNESESEKQDEKKARLQRAFQQVMVVSQTDDIYTAQCGMNILTHLAGNEEFLWCFHNEGLDCVGLLALTLRHSADEEIQRCCIKSLGLVCREESWQLMVTNKFELPRTLLDKLQPQLGPKLQAAALEALGQICSSEVMEKRILKTTSSEGVHPVDAVLTGLNHESLLVQIKCAQCIANLAQHPKLRAELHAGPRDCSVELLLILAGKANRNAQLQACRAVAVQAEHEPHVQKIFSENTEHRVSILKLCSSSDPEIKDWAMRAVACLVGESSGFDAGVIGEAIKEGVESDIALAKYYGDEDKQLQAARSLLGCAEDLQESQEKGMQEEKKMREEENKGRGEDQTEKRKKTEKEEKAITDEMLANSSGGGLLSAPSYSAGELMRKLEEQGGIRDLIALGFSGNHSVQLQIARAMLHLASDEKYRVMLILEGALAPLVGTLMKSPAQAVAEAATSCLKRLAVTQRAYVHGLRMPEPLIEDNRVFPSALFIGGKEGESIYRWYRLKPISEEEAQKLKAAKQHKKKRGGGALGKISNILMRQKSSMQHQISARDRVEDKLANEGGAISPGGAVLAITNGEEGETPGNTGDAGSDAQCEGHGMAPPGQVSTGTFGDNGMLALEQQGLDDNESCTEDSVNADTNGSGETHRSEDTSLSTSRSEQAVHQQISTSVFCEEAGGDKFWFSQEEIGRQRCYVPTVDDVHHRLMFLWIPISVTGVKGEVQYAISEGDVEPSKPTVLNVQVRRVHPEEALLMGQATYCGGIEGLSIFVWRRINRQGEKTVIRNATEQTYNPVDDDVGCRVEFGYVPVREDGARGRVVWSAPSETIIRFMPSFQGFHIAGSCVEGSTLHADGIFRGGRQGVHEMRWFRRFSPEDEWEPWPEGDDQRTYKLSTKDQNGYVRCVCQPNPNSNPNPRTRMAMCVVCVSQFLTQACVATLTLTLTLTHF